MRVSFLSSWLFMRLSLLFSWDLMRVSFLSSWYLMRVFHCYSFGTVWGYRCYPLCTLCRYHFFLLGTLCGYHCYHHGTLCEYHIVILLVLYEGIILSSSRSVSSILAVFLYSITIGKNPDEILQLTRWMNIIDIAFFLLSEFNYKIIVVYYTSQ